jgi:diguanylate cyclase
LKLDDERKRQKPPPLPSEFAIELLNALELPKGVRRNSNALIRKLANQGEQLDPEKIVNDIVALVGKALECAVEEGEPSTAQGKGLLGKLFGKDKEAGDEALLEESGAVKEAGASLTVARALLKQIIAGVLLPTDKASALSALIDESDRESQLQLLATQVLQLINRESAADTGLNSQQIREVLIQLLERLDLPQEFAEQVEKLKVGLEEGSSETDIEQGVVQIADLVARMRARIQSERKELENFLLQLTDRLGELDQEVQESLKLHHDSYSEGQDLNRDVDEQMKGIEISVLEVQELSVLKDVIQQRVDIIRQKMEEFRDSEEERLKTAEGKVKLLSDRLSRMEKESSTLRKRVEQERRLSLVDPLTGISNRLAYDERLEQEYARFKRYGAPLTLCVWDIDRFKQVNDTYGHQAGDKVLCIISKVLKQQVRQTDFVARYGGEEFILILPETNQEGACKMADTLRKSVEQCEFHFREEPVPVTVSCGISQFREGDTPEEVFARADKALYQAKKGGRNCCECS